MIPPNRQLIRTEYRDVIYRTEREKYSAVVEEIREHYEERRPVLVGTISIDNSEKLSRLLKRQAIPHVVLNAKYHAKEAEIVAQAGRKAAVTIATNMAGRGTDILLGGNPQHMALQSMREKGLDEDGHHNEYRRLRDQWDESFKVEHDQVVGLGGLHILGTERHESRRIDNQLRGRSGRQGGPRVVAVLFVLGGRSDAYLCQRSDLGNHAIAWHGGGSTDRE